MTAAPDEPPAAGRAPQARAAWLFASREVEQGNKKEVESVSRHLRPEGESLNRLTRTSGTLSHRTAGRHFEFLTRSGRTRRSLSSEVVSILLKKRYMSGRAFLAVPRCDPGSRRRAHHLDVSERDGTRNRQQAGSQNFPNRLTRRDWKRGQVRTHRQRLRGPCPGASCWV